MALLVTLSFVECRPLDFSAQDLPDPPEFRRNTPLEIVDKYIRGERSELVLEYRTTHDLMGEHEAVQREVERIWIDFLREEAERADVETIRVDVEEKGWDVFEDGVAQMGMSFRIRKDESGEWQKEGGFAFPPES